jgi:hypothetical protein
LCASYKQGRRPYLGVVGLGQALGRLDALPLQQLGADALLPDKPHPQLFSPLRSGVVGGGVGRGESLLRVRKVRGGTHLAHNLLKVRYALSLDALAVRLLLLCEDSQSVAS